MPDANLKGPWTADQIERFLTTVTIPVRLSAASESGWPIVLSLWYLYEDGVFKCATRRYAKIAEKLERNPRCAFEVAGDALPYHGVRGQGIATLGESGAEELLARLADRYIGKQDTPFRRWLLKDVSDEVAITIDPVRLMSWDYRDRMSKR